jgi:hypothetical protein
LRQIRYLTPIKSDAYAKSGEGGGPPSYTFPRPPRSCTGAALLRPKRPAARRLTMLSPSDNRELTEMNRDAILSLNFHLPILPAMLLLSSV